MNVRRSLFWLGSVLAVLAAVGGLGTFYLFTERVRLDDENRRELALVAHDFERILGAVNQSAVKLFSQRHSLKAFAQQNPYIQVEDLENKQLQICNPTEANYCSGFSDPKTLLLLSEAGKVLSIPVDIAKVFDDVAIGATFEYLFIADGGPVGNGSTDKAGAILYAMGYGEAARHRHGLGWLDLHSREHDDRHHAVIGLQHIAGLADWDGKPIDFKRLAGGRSLASGNALHVHGIAAGPVFAARLENAVPTAGGAVSFPGRLRFAFERHATACGIHRRAAGVARSQGLNSQAESSLRHLARTLEKNLTSEFGQMRDELVSADEQLKSNHQSQDSRCPGVENSLASRIL
jgi:hypothetical protein